MSALSSPLLRRCIVGSSSSCSRWSATTSIAVSTSTTAQNISETIANSNTLQRLHNPQQHRHESRRSFWMEVVRRKPNREKKKKHQNAFGDEDTKAKFDDGWVHEDPESVIRRHTDEVRSDGATLMSIYEHNDRHEKAWKKRQRLKNLRRYEFDKKHVNDLAKYIAFVKDNEDNNETNQSGQSK